MKRLFLIEAFIIFDLFLASVVVSAMANSIARSVLPAFLATVEQYFKLKKEFLSEGSKSDASGRREANSKLN